MNKPRTWELSTAQLRIDQAHLITQIKLNGGTEAQRTRLQDINHLLTLHRPKLVLIKGGKS